LEESQPVARAAVPHTTASKRAVRGRYFLAFKQQIVLTMLDNK
jgi:hypothetical protein